MHRTTVGFSLNSTLHFSLTKRKSSSTDFDTLANGNQQVRAVFSGVVTRDSYGKRRGRNEEVKQGEETAEGKSTGEKEAGNISDVSAW